MQAKAAIATTKMTSWTVPEAPAWSRTSSNSRNTKAVPPVRISGLRARRWRGSLRRQRW